MRAGPLASPTVVEMLNKHFVPVYISNEDYHGKTAVVSKDEYKAWHKIYVDALNEKRSAGSVCVYLVNPDSTGIASMIVSTAASKDNLLKLLQDTVTKLKIPAGETLVPPACQAGPPKVEPKELLLHLVSRVDHKGSWGEFPAENWIVLKEAEWKAWLPAGAKANETYTISDKEAARVLTCFFPQTEICTFAKMMDPDGPYKHRIDKIALHGKVLGVKNGKLQVRLDGSVKIKHTFYPDRDDKNYAESTLVGVLEVDQKSGRVTRLALATTQGRYGSYGFSVAVVTEM